MLFAFEMGLLLKLSVKPKMNLHGSILLGSWRSGPSQPQRITSGLSTNFNLSPSYSFHKPLYHKSFFSSKHSTNSIHNFRMQNQRNNNTFWSLSTFHEHLTQEPASSRVAYFILRAYTGTSVSHS